MCYFIQFYLSSILTMFRTVNGNILLTTAPSLCKMCQTENVMKKLFKVIFSINWWEFNKNQTPAKELKNSLWMQRNFVDRFNEHKHSSKIVWNKNTVLAPCILIGRNSWSYYYAGIHIVINSSVINLVLILWF